jgi:hypothetical protein
MWMVACLAASVVFFITGYSWLRGRDFVAAASNIVIALVIIAVCSIDLSAEHKPWQYLGVLIVLGAIELAILVLHLCVMLGRKPNNKT